MHEDIKKSKGFLESPWFKDGFTLKQYAAFALSFNRAKRQYDELSKTAHFRRICRNRELFPAFKRDDNLISGSNSAQIHTGIGARSRLISGSNPTQIHTADKPASASQNKHWNPQQPRQNEYKSLLTELRNYFSHYKSEQPDFLCQKNKPGGRPKGQTTAVKQGERKESPWHKEIEFLVREAVAVLDERDAKLDKDEEKHKKIKETLEDMREKPLKFFPPPFVKKNAQATLNAQPTLALIAAPFLIKSQMSFLSGKFFKGKSIETDSCEHQARMNILRILSQNDSILTKDNNPDNSFLSPKEETSYAIWGRLEANGFYDGKDAKAPEGFPEDQWFMKQLILYLECEKALPSVEFARTQTKNPESPSPLEPKTVLDPHKRESRIPLPRARLEPETVFDPNKRDRPLRIRNNTIEAVAQFPNRQKYRTNFGIHTLKYLVAGHLFKMPINDLTVKLLESRQTRKGETQKSFGFSPTRLEKHIDRLIEKHSQPSEKIRLYAQIRFICRFINEAWNKKHSRYMRKEEFEEFQTKVRHYHKNSFYYDLKQQGLLNIAGLGLGCKDDKTLSTLFVKTRIQEIFKDMTKAHIDWLKAQTEILPKLSPDKRKTLTSRLPLKNIEKKEAKSDLKPVALQSGDIQKEIAKHEGKDPKRFFDYVRQLLQGEFPFSFFGLTEENTESTKKGYGCGANRERAARTGLILKMISRLIGENILPTTNKPSKQDIERKLNNTIKIKFKLTQGWRHYAKYNKKRLLKLIQAYHPGFTKGVVPLLDETREEDPNPIKPDKQGENTTRPASIQSLRKKSDQERFLLMQALLKWERNIIQKKKPDNSIKREDNIPEGVNPQTENKRENKTYISFDEVLRMAKITKTKKDELKECRNACMHDNIWEKPFSDVPGPVQSLYKDLKNRENEKRKTQKQEGRQRARSPLKNTDF